MLFLLSEQGDTCLGKAALLLSRPSHCRLLTLLLQWPPKKPPAGLPTRVYHRGDPVPGLGNLVTYVAVPPGEESLGRPPMQLQWLRSGSPYIVWTHSDRSTWIAPAPSAPIPMQLILRLLPLATRLSSLLLSLHFFPFFLISLFQGSVPKRLPPPYSLFLQLLPHTLPLQLSGYALSHEDFSPAAFSHQLWFHLPSFRQCCRLSPAFNFPGPCPSENNHCPQGPQITSSVPGKMWINHGVTALTSDFSHRSVFGRGKGIEQSKGVTDIFME